MNIEALSAVEYTKETCDDELVALRSAAERAQDAAKRFEMQTQSLSETESLLLLKESKKFIKLPPSIDESQNLRSTITPYPSTLVDNRPELRDDGVVTFFGCNTALPYSDAPDYSGLGELPLSTEASFGLRVVSDVPSSPSRSLRMLDSALAADLGATAQPSHTEQQQLRTEVGESPSLIIVFSSSGRPGVANLIKRGGYRLLTQNTSSTQAPEVVRTTSGPSLILVFTVRRSPVIAYSIKTGRTLSLVDEPSVPILRSITVPDEPEIHEEGFTDIQDPRILIENAGAQNQLMDREVENTANLTKSSPDVDTLKRQRSEFSHSPKSKLESPLSPLAVGRTLLHGQYSDEQPPELYLGLNKIDREVPGRLDSLYKSVFVLLLADDEAFNDIFARYVYPYIVASAKRYQDLLSEDKLCSIGRDVSAELGEMGFGS